MHFTQVLTAFLISCIAFSSCNTSKRRSIRDLKCDPEEIRYKLQNFELSLSDNQTPEGFHYHEKFYFVNAPIEETWKVYTETPAKEYWTGPKTTFLKGYSKADNLLYLNKQEGSPSLQKGMVYELNLRCAALFNIVAAFEMTTLDAMDKKMVFTYGKDNASHGRQTLQFVADGNKTKIIHSSHFKSGSSFRDKRLYPKFHEKCIDEFHENFRRKIEKI